MILPNDSQRLTIVGRTGSGKTQAAAWHLSRRSWDKMPWIVYDYKYDELLNSITGVEHIGAHEPPPTKPGIYLVHPHPDDTELVREQMGRIWSNENTGVYVDEGYMVCSPQTPNPQFRSLLTQGRSKHIPIIINSQRPSWLDRFVWSESEFYQVFDLQTKDDHRTMESKIPVDMSVPLADFHSWYYDIKHKKMLLLKPVPKWSDILNVFNERIESMKKKPVHRFVFI